MISKIKEFKSNFSGYAAKSLLRTAQSEADLDGISQDEVLAASGLAPAEIRQIREIAAASFSQKAYVPEGAISLVEWMANPKNIAYPEDGKYAAIVFGTDTRTTASDPDANIYTQAGREFKDALIFSNAKRKFDIVKILHEEAVRRTKFETSMVDHYAEMLRDRMQVNTAYQAIVALDNARKSYISYLKSL